MATKLLERRRVAVVGLAGAVGLLAGCGGGGSSGRSNSASTVAPSTSAVSPATSATAPLNLASGRALHTATLLKSGEVLVVGGVDAAGKAIDQTAILTPTSVKVGPRLLSPRVGHTATVLENGQVLISGGQIDLQAQATLDSTEIFDPLAGNIVNGPKLGAARSQHIAAAFGPVGAQQVLIAGGFNGKAPMDSAELYDVKAGKFSAVKAKLAEATAGANAARLDDGTIVIAGGDGAQGPAGAQIFDPVAATFTATKITVKRSGSSFAASAREVLLAGGQSTTGIERSTELYDIATKMFTAGPQLLDARRDGAAARVGTNQVVVVGGRSGANALNTVEVLEGATFAQSTVRQTASLQQGRYGHTATALSSGKVLVIGGFDASGTVLASVESVDPNAAATPSVGTPVVPPVIAPPTTVGTPTTGGTTTTPPASGGLGGLLGGLLGGGAGTGSTGGSIWSKIGNAALTTVTTNGFSGGIGGFFKSFLGNLVNQFVPGLIGGSTTGSTSTSGSTSSSGGIGSVLSGLLGKVFGGGSSTPATPAANAPAVLTMSPGYGSVGDKVTITGVNFTTPVKVTFTAKQGFFSKVLGFITGKKGSVEATISGQAPGATTGSTVLTLTVPQNAITGDVTVETNGSKVSAGNFQVQ